MGIKIWNMEPQQVNLLVSRSGSTIICTISTYDMSKPYTINDSNILSVDWASNYIKNSTPITIIFTLWYSDGDASYHEVSPGEQIQTGGDCSQVKCSAKTPTNNLTPGVTAT